MMKNSTLRTFRLPVVFTFVGLVVAFILGQTSDKSGFKAVFFCALLSLLEISLSLDNAVVNASILRKMNEVWRRRFLTWGILIAVFGMRLLFPVLIAAILARLGPLEALRIAASDPDRYADLMTAAHIPVAAFGGSFLLMVSLRHFFTESQTRWIKPLENGFAKLGRLPYSDIAVTLFVLFAMSFVVSERSFLYAGLFGLITFIAVDGLAHLLNRSASHSETSAPLKAHRASLGLFIYLEVLDASFSFDGVIGAFAITTNLFIITIGLGIGAFFVRGLTVLLVEDGALENLEYLEAGAFWAILSLAIIMFTSVVVEVPEILTGVIGAAFLTAAFVSSRREARKVKAQSPRKLTAANP